MNLTIGQLFSLTGGFSYLFHKGGKTINGYPEDPRKELMTKISKHSDTNPGTKPKSIFAGLKYKYLMKR
jgi:hypothetical protein